MSSGKQLMEYSTSNQNLRFSGKFSYILRRDGTASIAGYTGSAEELAVPAQLDGKRDPEKCF